MEKTIDHYGICSSQIGNGTLTNWHVIKHFSDKDWDVIRTFADKYDAENLLEELTKAL